MKASKGGYSLHQLSVTAASSRQHKAVAPHKKVRRMIAMPRLHASRGRPGFDLGETVPQYFQARALETRKSRKTWTLLELLSSSG